jgi:hypothetical protein
MEYAMRELYDVRGAVYIPTRTYNAYQMWSEYKSEEMERNTGYAASLRLNALRIWLSYELWLENSSILERSFDDMLALCSKRGISVMPSLFEHCGVEPTPEALKGKDPFKAFAVASPGNAVVSHRDLWEKPRQYVEWFMRSFGNDDRLLAIEVMNEPCSVMELAFAQEMNLCMSQKKGSVAFSIGAVGGVRSIAHYRDWDLDTFQYHYNFPRSREIFEASLQEAAELQAMSKRPVWISEWQRVRKSTSGWMDKPLSGDEWAPDLASLADLVREYPVGNFFWSLMLKPAYLPVQRSRGTLNGVFHEDGAVWSLIDARAVSDDPSFSAVERKEWPEWARAIPEKLALSWER